MEFREYYSGDLRCIFENGSIDTIVYNKLTWTLCHNEKVLACGGFVKIWNGVYEVWIYTKDYETFLHNKIKIIKKFYHELNKLSWHRIHAPVSFDTRNHKKLMELLGFSPEGLLRKYGPDKKDHIIYSMVK